DAFPVMVRQFTQAATSDAIDEIASPVNGRPTDPASLASQLSGTNDQLTANLNFLNIIIQNNGWMPGLALWTNPTNPIPSSSEWTLGAGGLIRLYTRWPQLARSNALYTQRLNAVINSGFTLPTALERITLLRSGGQWQTNALWGDLIQNYRNRAAQFLAELQLFELQQRTNLVAGPEASQQPDARQVDFWGAVDQPTDYVPAAFLKNIPAL